MRIAREKDRIVLVFNFLENSIMRRALAEIAHNYKAKPGDVDPKVAAVWYSLRGCHNAKMTPEETRDWLETLHGFRSARLKHLETWGKTLARRQNGEYRLSLDSDEAHSLMTALNDHRLMLAALHDIGQNEMDLHSLQELKGLSSQRQTALFSIHLMAGIIEALLRLISPEAASWMDSP